MANTPPYRLETERLVLRCWQPTDAPLLQEAVVASLDHLRPWLPWIAYEPISLRDRVEYMRRARGAFDRDEEYTLAVFDREERRVLGGSGFHKRSTPEAIEIGYWIRADSLRRGLCSELVAVLTQVALRRCDFERVEIHADPDNVASQGVPAKLGYQKDAVMRRRSRTPAGAECDTVIWSMFADELERSPCASIAYSAFDVCGNALA
ncbi:MAG TPA: GNAT family N-acetyltransferase [Polyangiales bacterium]|nr:GNAT family N-acetyltransferase [Polyangiales bacterium]